MTDLPYTDDDLRAEAAAQHAGATDDPDFMGVGVQMTGSEVCPDGGVDWDDFSEDTFEKAQCAVHDLINHAADISRWAVDLGADGLEPVEEHIDDVGARIHFAFSPDMTDTDRHDVIATVTTALITDS